jgi:ribose transport system ATP-binding protein
VAKGGFISDRAHEATQDEGTPNTPFGASAVSLVGIHKSFDVTRALDGASFNASLGEIHAIFGGNGSGKSTLAKVISGVLPIDSGQVNVLGHTPNSPHDARGVGVATVFQEVLVADESSLLDNLYLGADRLWSRTLTRAAKGKAAETLITELTGLDLDLEMPASALPLNLKAWITIGRALLSKPKILILDESSAALDLDSTERLFAKIRELRDAGSCILIVTHRIAEMTRIADRVTVLRDGRDVGVLVKGEITEANLLRLMSGGKPNRPEKTVAQTADVHDQGVVMKTDAMKIWPRSSGIDFRLHRGEILGAAGLDGHGQSDFVRVLAGVQRAHGSGPVVVGEKGVFHPINSLADAARYKVGYVSGDRKREGIFANLSVFENMLAPLYRAKSRAGKLALIDWTALNGSFEWEREKLTIRMGDRGDKITSLSGGNQQKVLIGRAFALNPNILILNDPARGVDIGAKTDLYAHLRDFAAAGKSVVYMSSEIEELVGFCSRVLVFRNGHVFAELTGDAIHSDEILAAMFGQHATTHAAPRGGRLEKSVMGQVGTLTPEIGDDLEAPSSWSRPKPERRAVPSFTLRSAAFADRGVIPDRYAEANLVSPPLDWDAPPEGARSFALTMTDPDLPPELGFPRAFAHWLLADIPSGVTQIVEGASGTPALPRGAREFASDFVTFRIPGYGRGYGGPWPPDDAHRYVFTLYALKADRIELEDTADYVAFVRAVLPSTIMTATLVGLYGPAKAPLPNPA